MNDLLNMNDRLIERLRRRDAEIERLRAVLNEVHTNGEWITVNQDRTVILHANLDEQGAEWLISREVYEMVGEMGTSVSERSEESPE